MFPSWASDAFNLSDNPGFRRVKAMTVEPPIHDDLSGLVPKTETHRACSEFVVSLMECWDTSKPETERRMEQYTLEHCEYLIRERWGVYDEC